MRLSFQNRRSPILCPFPPRDVPSSNSSGGPAVSVPEEKKCDLARPGTLQLRDPSVGNAVPEFAFKRSATPAPGAGHAQGRAGNHHPGRLIYCYPMSPVRKFESQTYKESIQI